MTTIAVDVDDTLYSFSNLARGKFIDVAIEKGDKRLQRGAYCAWGEWRSPSDLIEGDYWMEIIDLCHQPETILAQEPYPHAAETLWELVNQGYDLHYISNRKAETWHVTYQWLVERGFPVREMPDGTRSSAKITNPTANLTLTCTTDDKMLHLTDCQYIIDDRPKTLVQFVYNFDWQNKYGSQNGDKRRLGFGIFGEYNRALTDVTGVYLAPNWVLLRQYLIEKGVLNG